MVPDSPSPDMGCGSALGAAVGDRHTCDVPSVTNVTSLGADCAGSRPVVPTLPQCMFGENGPSPEVNAPPPVPLSSTDSADDDKYLIPLEAIVDGSWLDSIFHHLRSLTAGPGARPIKVLGISFFDG